MAERGCKKCFHYKACKEVASHSGYGDIHYTESQCKNFISADDVVPMAEVSEYVSTDEPVKIARAVQLAAEAARANGYKQGATDTARAFADRLIAYYKNLKGTTSPALAAYHVEQVLKDFIKEKEST